MKKIIFIIFCAMAWYLFAALYISPKEGFENWFYGFIVYLIGMAWVLPFLLSKDMFTPYAGPTLTTAPKYKWIRIHFFIIGLFISLSATLFLT